MVLTKTSDYEIFDNLPGALIEIRLENQSINYMNKIAQVLFGYSPGEIDQGISARNIFKDGREYERAVHIVEKFALESVEKNVPYTRLDRQDLYDFTLKRKTGEIFLGECQGSFVLDNVQVPIAIRIHIRDLTEQRLVEKSLHESEEKYRTLVESSADSIILLDEDNQLISINAAGLELLGLTRDRAQGQNFMDIFPEDVANVISKHIQVTRDSNASSSCDLTLGSNRAPKWISASLTPVRTHGESSGTVLFIGRDITDRKHAENQLELALVKAKTANSAKDEFIANMSHEFRTPITSIIGFSNYLKSNIRSRLDEKEKEAFDSIYRNSNRLLRTVNAILSYAKTLDEAHNLDPSIIYLNKFVGSICDAIRPSAIEKGIELAFYSETNEDKVWLDEFSIYEAISNIIHNAIKFTQDGKVSVYLKKEHDQLFLEVVDTGIGIPDDFLEELYKPFTQASKGLAREYQGLGVGLALTKRYLDWNQVDIQIKSKRNEGTTVTLTFPQNLD